MDDPTYPTPDDVEEDPMCYCDDNSTGESILAVDCPVCSKEV